MREHTFGVSLSLAVLLVERQSSEYTVMKTGRAVRKNEEILSPPPLLSPPSPSAHTRAASWESTGVREP